MKQIQERHFSKNNFAKDVLAGFNATPKSIPSKYFYDEHGDKFFQEIMRLDAYYPTRCEVEILSRKSERIARYFHGNRKLSIVEFGAGDGLKTRIILQRLKEEKLELEYIPVDISKHALLNLKLKLESQFSQIPIYPVCCGFKNGLALVNSSPETSKLILFLGASIGNLDCEETSFFLRELSASMNEKDVLVIGIDLKKDPEVVLNAYNDPQGVTRAFNLNLLTRINRELGGDFDISKFSHYPVYDPDTGEAKSYLVSKDSQVISISGLSSFFQFYKGEHIQTERSKKYSLAEISKLAESTGFRVMENLLDCRNYFTDSIWMPDTVNF